VTYPQTPEIIAGGNGCAFRWNAENQKQTNLIDGIFLCCAAVLFQKIGVFLSERFDRGELFDSQFVKMILRCLVQ